MDPKYMTKFITPIIGLADLFPLEHRIFNALICSIWVMDAVAAIELFGKKLTIQGDRTLVESAIINLAVNSRDAMPDGGTLTISSGTARADLLFVNTHLEAKPGIDYAWVRVADTGKGIDDRVRQHLFEPFITTKGPGKGTGLGLASVYGTVKAHGGFIDFVSRKDQGTSFTLYIPASGATIGPAEQKKAFPLAKGGMILLIDDEEIILRVEELSLRKQGYEVSSFNDPVAAVAFYREHAAGVSCVVLDMVMPKINGRECYELLHAVNPKVKAIITTGFANDAEFDAFVARYKLPVIAKPFDTVKVIELLDRILM
jgi:CheY-like chemotaxis protein